MAVTPVSPLTGTGVLLLVVVPSPSSPAPLLPQARTVPSDSNAYASLLPPAMAVTPVSPLTGTGVLLLVTVPMPMPSWLYPQPGRCRWWCSGR